MSTKIYAAEGVRTFFKRWQGNVDNPSGIVNKAISRYNHILLHNLPNFSSEEWGAIFDIVAEYGEMSMGDIERLPKLFAQTLVEDSKLTSRWGINLEDTLPKVKALNLVSAIAVVDTAERYLTTHTFENVGLPFKSRVIQ